MKNRFLKFISDNYPGILSVVVFILVWEAASRERLVDKVFISMPTEIIKQGSGLVATGEFWNSFGYSLAVFYSGFLLAVVLGFIFGLFIGFFPLANKIFKPYMFMLSALPMAAMVPLIIIWFGIGIASKIIIVFLMAVVPVFINTIEGVRGASRDLKNMARSFGAGKLKILKAIIFWDALPFAFSGAKIGVGRGIIGLVISEIFGYGVGLGYLVGYFGNTFQTAKLLVVIVFLIAINFVTVFAVDMISKKMINWQSIK